jgi:hypothetical protein
MSITIHTKLSLERAIMAFAGFMILMSLGLTVWLSPHFIWLSAFVGANLFQSAFTGLCPAAKVMSRLGIKTQAQLTQEKLNPNYHHEIK